MAIEVGSAYVSIIPSFRGFGRELSRQLTAETAGVGKTAGERISRDIGGGLKGAGKTTADFGNKLNRNVTLPIAGAGALAFKAFGDFDQTMRQVAVQTGLSGTQLADFNKLALDMGAKTSFSAGQAADAMLELAKGGLTAAQIKGGALQETLTLAAAGGLELGDAAGTMANTLNTFGLKATDSAKVAAALAGGANASTASVGSLAQAMAQVGPGAKLVGLSLNDTVAALAAFDNAGVKGSDAGTSLKTMLTRLIPTTKSASDAMKSVGLSSDSFFDATGKMRPMEEVAGKLQGAMKGLTKEQQQATLTTIFGSDSYRAAAILAQQGADGITKMKKATTNLSAAQEMAKTNTEGQKGSVEQLKGSVETAAIQLGTVMSPAVTDLVGDLTKLVNKFGELSPETQKLTLMGGGILAALGPVTSVIGKTVTGLGQTVTAAQKVGSGMKKAATGVAGFGQGLKDGQSGLSAFAGPAQRLGSFVNRGLTGAFTALRGPVVAAAGAVKGFTLALLANPIGIAIAAIVALVAIGIVLYKKWTPFRELVDKVWASIKTLAVTVATFAVAAFQKFVAVAQTVWAAVQRGWAVFTNLLAIATRVFLAIANVVTQPIQGIIGVLQGLWNIIAGIFTGNLDRIGTGVAQAIGGIVRFFFGAPARIIQAIIPLLPAIGAFFVRVFKAIGSAIAAGFVAVVGFFKAAPGRIWRAIVAVHQMLVSLMTRALVAAKNAVVAGFNAVLAYVKATPQRFINNMQRLGSMLSSLGSKAMSLLHSAVTTGATNVVTFIKGLPQRIISGLGNLGSTLSSAGRDVMNGFIGGIRDMAGNLITAIRETVTDKIPGYVKKALGIASPSKVFFQIGRWTVEGLRKGITETAPKAVAAARRVALAIADAAAFAMRKKGTTKAQKRALAAQAKAATAMLNATMKKLDPMLKTRDALDVQIASVTKQVAALRGAKERVRAALAEQLEKGRDLFGGALEGVLPEPQAIADRLKRNLDAITKFGATLKALAAKGFDNAIIEQIASQGVDAGTRMADVLAASTPAQVKSINGSFAAIGSAASSTATSVASSMYDAGIRAADGLLAGLVSKRDKLEAAMVNLADSLVKAIQKKLKIKSPSRVFADVGDNIGAGLEGGIAGRQKSVHKALDGLVRRPNPNALIGTAGALAAQGQPTVRVFIGDRELTSIVRTEVDYSQTGMARQLAYGRRV